MNSYPDFSEATPDATLLDLQRHRLEVLLDSSVKSAHRPNWVTTALKTWGQQLVHWLTEGSMLRISNHTQDGKPGWTAYDPIGDRLLQFESEEALRTWIDQRYSE